MRIYSTYLPRRGDYAVTNGTKFIEYNETPSLTYSTEQQLTFAMLNKPGYILFIKQCISRSAGF